MSRMKVVLSIALLLAPFAAIHAAVIAEKKPNIVLILVDDLGYGDPGCFNANSKIATPNPDISCSTREGPYTVCSDQVYRFNRFGDPG